MFSTQFVSVLVGVEHGPQRLRLDALVLEHLVVHSCIVTFNRESSLWCLGVNNVVVVAVWAVFVALLESLHILAEALFAFFAGEDHFCGAFEVVIGLFRVAFGAVEPLSAAGSADGHLGVEDVFAGRRMLDICIADGNLKYVPHDCCAAILGCSSLK